VMGPNTFSGQPLTEVVFTGAEPPRIVREWSEWNGAENTNCFEDVAPDWEFSTWQGEVDFTVLVPAAYAGNWGGDQRRELHMAGASDPDAGKRAGNIGDIRLRGG